jgi:hypothetical protein
MQFKEWILKEEFGLQEMPKMSLVKKKVFADDVPLKTAKIDDIEKNIVIFRESRKNTFINYGATWVYFMDSEESAEDIKNGKIPMLMFPRGTWASGGSPITDIWKSRFARPGTEHILGVMEGNILENEIFVDMISVRAPWRRNHVATSMINVIKKNYPQAKVVYSSPTELGRKLFTSVPDSEKSD